MFTMTEFNSQDTRTEANSSQSETRNSLETTESLLEKRKRDKLGRFPKGHLPHGWLGMGAPVQVGQKFGDWRVVSPKFIREEGKKCYVKITCECEGCGRTYAVDWHNLTAGLTKRCSSCGIKKAKLTKDLERWGRPMDEVDVWLYERWDAIMRRCYDPKTYSYPSYGGRGITVHEDFHDGVKFVNYCKALPNCRRDFQIDRTDNSLGYAPGNVRFVTQTDNMANRRNSLSIKYNDKTYSTVEFHRLFCPKVSYGAVARKAKMGFSGEQIIATKARPRVRRGECRAEAPLLYNQLARP